MRQLVLMILIALALAAPLALSEASDTPPTYHTHCQYGHDQTTYAYSIDDDSRIYPDTQGGQYYIFHHPLWVSVWEESNNRPGLQVDERICTMYDMSTGANLGSYTLYGPDTLVVEVTHLW